MREKKKSFNCIATACVNEHLGAAQGYDKVFGKNINLVTKTLSSGSAATYNLSSEDVSRLFL